MPTHSKKRELPTIFQRSKRIVTVTIFVPFQRQLNQHKLFVWKLIRRKLFPRDKIRNIALILIENIFLSTCR